MFRDSSDVELISLFKGGNQDAFTTLFNRWHKPLTRMVSKRITDDNAIDDVVQRCFLKVLATLDRYDPSKATFERWLFWIACGIIVDTHRSRAKDLLYQSTSLDSSTCDETPKLETTTSDRRQVDPMSQVLAAEWKQEFWDFVNSLSPEVLQVFEAVFVGGLKYTQVTRLYDVPAETVKYRARVACKKIREHFEEAPDFAGTFLSRLEEVAEAAAEAA